MILLLALSPWLAATGATNVAQVRLFSLSVRVEPGTASPLGLTYTLEFGSADPRTPNHEFFSTFEDDLTHGTYLRLDGPEFPEPLLGELVVPAPEHLDGNGNGIPDFYEVSEAIDAWSGTAYWATEVAWGEGTITWQRAAGDYHGVVRLRLESDEFGVLPEFTHRFEIIEYSGTLTYQPSPDPVFGDLMLRRVGREDLFLAGPMTLTREPTNRLHHFAIGESTLTNHLGQLIEISLGDVESDPDYSMDYFGALAFWDGDPDTPEPDFEIYFIGIDDPNDANGNGIPDLTDDTDPPPAPPELEIDRHADGFLLTVRGQIGVTYVLQRASGLDPDLWIEDRLITLASEREEFVLPVPAATARFWRLRWP